jgi:hypothetical protein
VGAPDGVLGLARGRDRAARADGHQPVKPLGQAHHHACRRDNARADGDRCANEIEHVIDARHVVGGNFCQGRD